MYSIHLALQNICLSLFLFIPCYYAVAESWLNDSPVEFMETTIGRDGVLRGLDEPTPITRPAAVHLSPSRGMGHTVLPCDIDHLELRAARMQAKWHIFTVRRDQEWVVVAASAFTFVAASLAMFQMPADPVMRLFLFLAILRATATAVYALILLLFFREEKMKSGEFAKVWFQYINGQNGSPLTPWSLLALPAVSLCWAAIFFISSLFYSIWRGGLTPLPNIAESQPLAVVLRMIITVPSAMDLVCALWLCKVMKRLRSALEIN